MRNKKKLIEADEFKLSQIMADNPMSNYKLHKRIEALEKKMNRLFELIGVGQE